MVTHGHSYNTRGDVGPGEAARWPNIGTRTGAAKQYGILGWPSVVYEDVTLDISDELALLRWPRPADSPRHGDRTQPQVV